MKPMTLRHFGRASLVASATLMLTAAPAPIAAAGARKNAPAPVPATAHDGGIQLLSVGQSKVINLSTPMSDVIIADPKVADVHVRSARQLYLIAKGAGQSDVTVTDIRGKVIYRAMVRVGNNLTSVDQMLKLAMPDADITVSTLNNTLLLTGTVATPEDGAEAERLVTAFVGTGTSVISRLRTATPLTVNLQVRIVEVNKSIGKQIGMNLVTSDSTSGFKFGVGQGRSIINTQWVPGGSMLGVGNGIVPTGTASAVGALSSGTTFAGQGKLFGLDILAALDMAENQGLASTLANPNLTALSGETASFLAGGEIPIPIASAIGQISVDYKQYGVMLSFTPTVLADGRISMRVRPEVSQLDASAGVVLSGFSVPGISTRRVETTVELGSGQSFMIGGLMSASSSNSITKTPFLGDLPVLGNLFKSTNYNRKQTELVVIVTPYLVKPVNARDIRLPTDGLRNANDAQRYLGSMLHDGQSGEERPVPTMAPPVTVPAGSPSPASGSAGTTPRKPGKNAAPGFSF